MFKSLLPQNYVEITDPNYIVRDGDLVFFSKTQGWTKSISSVGQTIAEVNEYRSKYRFATKSYLEEITKKYNKATRPNKEIVAPEGYHLLEKKYHNSFWITKENRDFIQGFLLSLNRWCNLTCYCGFTIQYLIDNQIISAAATKGHNAYPYGF